MTSKFPEFVEGNIVDGDFLPVNKRIDKDRFISQQEVEETRKEILRLKLP